MKVKQWITVRGRNPIAMVMLHDDEVVKPGDLIHLDGVIKTVVAVDRSENAPQILNVNGDPAAGEIAAAIGAERLIFLTDVAGVDLHVSLTFWAFDNHYLRLRRNLRLRLCSYLRLNLRLSLYRLYNLCWYLWLNLNRLHLLSLHLRLSNRLSHCDAWCHDFGS